MESTKKYVSVLDAPAGTKIVTCSQVLHNKLQCWRAGDFVVTETIPSEVEGVPDREVVYQLCTQHAKIQAAKDLQAVQDKESSSVEVPQASGEAFKSQTETLPPGTDAQHPVVDTTPKKPIPVPPLTPPTPSTPESEQK